MLLDNELTNFIKLYTITTFNPSRVKIKGDKNFKRGVQLTSNSTFIIANNKHNLKTEIVNSLVDTFNISKEHANHIVTDIGNWN
jgi:hypothetical protein